MSEAQLACLLTARAGNTSEVRAEIIVRGEEGGGMVKNACYFSRKKKLGFQHPLQVIHNYLYPDQGF